MLCKHERISEFYDIISAKDEEVEMGCPQVSKDGKWGYISLESGKELAMYDDASYFLEPV